jgi:precorrin-3B synthase
MSAALTRGWCPGALRPMDSGDGLIVRLRIGGGIVPVALAAAIADWSRRWGNGRIDLTNRANLQLRGVPEQHLPALREALAAWNLLDASAAGEAVRNVISSPLAGLDPAAVLDTRGLAAELEQHLGRAVVLHDLPGKFGFAIDDGGAFGLEDVAADIRFAACRTVDGPGFDINVAGVTAPIGRCCPGGLVAAADDLCRVFLRLRSGQETRIRRMRDVVAVFGVVGLTHPNLVLAGEGPLSTGFGGRKQESRGWRAFARHDDGGGAFARRDDGGGAFARRDDEGGAFARHDDGGGAFARRDDEGGAFARRDGEGGAFARRDDGGGATAPVFTRQGSLSGGIGPHPLGSAAFAGVGLPFGRCSGDDFARLASLAADNGAAELRLTPWRAILVPVASLQMARTLSAGLGAGFILDPLDPRRRIAACPGAPSCTRGTTPVHADAAALAEALADAPGPGIAAHVSGCEKGCAHPGPAPITLVARNGQYDLVRDGRASDPPAARGLTIHHATEQVRHIMAGMA